VAASGSTTAPVMILVGVALGASPAGELVPPAGEVPGVEFVTDDGIGSSSTPPLVVAGSRGGDTEPLGDAILPALGDGLLIS
jgi:hypothetical protein